jgi:hypothetical protein
VTKCKSTYGNHDRWAVEDHESGLIDGSLRPETTRKFHDTVYAPDLDRQGSDGNSCKSCQLGNQQLKERREHFDIPQMKYQIPRKWRKVSNRWFVGYPPLRTRAQRWAARAMKTKSNSTWNPKPATRMCTPRSALCYVLPVAAGAPPKACKIRETRSEQMKRSRTSLAQGQRKKFRSLSKCGRARDRLARRSEQARW